MIDDLNELLVATGLFVGLHVLIPIVPLRSRIMRSVGTGGYRGLFALQSLFLLIWMFRAYAHAPVFAVWEPAVWLLPVPVVLGFAGMILIVASVGLANPTAGQAIDGSYAVAGVLRVTRNPQLWGIALMMGGHLAACGSAAAMILFGALTALAVGGSFLIDHRLATLADRRWAPFAEATSNLPFLAMMRGRQPFDLAFATPRTLGIAFAVTLVMLMLHPAIRAGYALI